MSTKEKYEEYWLISNVIRRYEECLDDMSDLYDDVVDFFDESFTEGVEETFRRIKKEIDIMKEVQANKRIEVYGK